MGIGNPVHLIFLGAIALLVLGPKRLPELARSLGDGIREFRSSLEQAASGDHDHTEALTPAAQPQPGQAQLAQIAPALQPAGPSAEQSVDPPQPVPSGDAPDSRPL